MKSFHTLLKTELKLSLRGMDMVIFALCMPVAVLVLLGAVYGDRPAFEGAGYTFLEQSFGALCTISICAGGVMGLPLVVSDYRARKILKRFRVTPVSPGMILAVQVVVYILYALASLALLALAGAALFGVRFQGDLPVFAAGYALVLVSTFSIGMMVGGVAPNTKIAGAVASLLYFPMLLLSGATLPYEVMPAALQRVAGVLPLSQGVKLLKGAFLGQPTGEIWVPAVILAAVAAVCGAVAVRFFRWE